MSAKETLRFPSLSRAEMTLVNGNILGMCRGGWNLSDKAKRLNRTWKWTHVRLYSWKDLIKLRGWLALPVGPSRKMIASALKGPAGRRSVFSARSTTVVSPMAPLEREREVPGKSHRSQKDTRVDQITFLKLVQAA